ncbi:hypothetical protein [Nocardiopsis sp. NPDC006832]|uniref:hypothetical protein n=1 Tax=Nocardiopsis sp. NPDC006832 TaxID=3157188 RepID=UPI0033E1685F
MSSIRTPLSDLRFEISHRFRPFDLIAPGFVVFDTDDPEVLNGGAGRTVLTGHAPVAPFATVLVDVGADPIGGAAAAGGTVTAGLRSGEEGSEDGVVVVYDAGVGQVRLEVTVDGTTTVAADAPVRPVLPHQLAVTVTGNVVTALVRDEGAEWGDPLLGGGADVRTLVDLRDPGLLGRWEYAFGVSGAGLRRVRAGYFGQVGLRDPQLITHADGRPYIRDGRFFLTAGCAGMGFAQEAHWAVWEFDPDAPDRMRQTAKLFFAHDGIVTGDNAGHVVYDEASGHFSLVVCGGDLPTPGVHVRCARTDADLLTGVHVIPNTRLAAPSTLSAWEPSLARIDGRWHVLYADVVRLAPELEFRPVLAVSEPGADLSAPMTIAAVDTASRRTEGCVLRRVGGGWWALATDDAQRVYKVYDMDLRRLGEIDAPYVSGGPHPQAFPVSSEPGADWVMVTFDDEQYAQDVLGYGTEGNVVVMRAPGARRSVPGAGR